jgi:hypothetical protein
MDDSRTYVPRSSPRVPLSLFGPFRQVGQSVGVSAYSRPCLVRLRDLLMKAVRLPHG